METSTFTVELTVRHTKPIPSAETMSVVAASMLGSVIGAQVDGRVISAFIVKPNGESGEAAFWESNGPLQVLRAAAGGGADAEPQVMAPVPSNES